MSSLLMWRSSIAVHGDPAFDFVRAPAARLCLAHQTWRAALAAEENRHIARRRNREFEITLRREVGARHLDEQLFAVSDRRPQL